MHTIDDQEDILVGYRELVFTGSWNSYEESGEMQIYCSEGKYFSREGGTSVYDEPETHYWGTVEEITEDQALAIMLDWED